jgi:hypothetical protein
MCTLSGLYIYIFMLETIIKAFYTILSIAFLKEF